MTLPGESHVTRREAVVAISSTIATLTPTVLCAPAAHAEVSPRAEAGVARLLRLTNVPSLALAKATATRVATQSYGVVRSGTTAAATPDTVYAAASLTKSVFAFLVLGLVVDGALSLDRPVHEYLALPRPDDARARRITVRHLLSHTSGWRNWRLDPTVPLTTEFEPGSRWSYSGEGFFFLQRLIEQLTGTALGTLAREGLFLPLGMSRSGMMSTHSLAAVSAAPHNSRGEPNVPAASGTLDELQRIVAARGATLDAVRTSEAESALRVVNPSRAVLPVSLAVNAAASMVTTANDFGRFIRHLIQARRAGGRDALIVALMMTPQVRLNEALHWGLGIGLEERDGRLLAWQWGDNPGFKSFMLVDPLREWGMALFTNADRGAQVYDRVLRDVLHYDLAALLWN